MAFSRVLSSKHCSSMLHGRSPRMGYLPVLFLRFGITPQWQQHLEKYWPNKTQNPPLLLQQEQGGSMSVFRVILRTSA